MKEKIAIVFFNLGGPDKSESIRPFLRNLFSDKAIIDLPFFARLPLAALISFFRAPKAKPLYDIMGGFSPLLTNTIAQKKALESYLNSKNINSEVFIAMRYWHPFANEAIKQVKEYNPDKIVLLPLYPQYSSTTSGSSYEEWMKLAPKEWQAKTIFLKAFPALPGFIKASAEAIIEKYNELGKENIRLLFSAHGLPKKIIEKGDPYEKQVNQTAHAIRKLLPENLETIVCYQSKVGPLEWLGPSTPDAIESAAKDNKNIILYPIAFVSDHIETLVELDVEYHELSHELGIKGFARAPTVGTNPLFINSLGDMVINSLDK